MFIDEALAVAENSAAASGFGRKQGRDQRKPWSAPNGKALQLVVLEPVWSEGGLTEMRFGGVAGSAANHFGLSCKHGNVEY